MRKITRKSLLRLVIGLLDMIKNIFGLVVEYAGLSCQSVSLSSTDHIGNAEELAALLENNKMLTGERVDGLRELTYQLLSLSRHQCELDKQVKRVTAGLKELTGLREQRGLSHGEYIKEIEAYVYSVSPEDDRDLSLYLNNGYNGDEWIQDGLLLYGGCNEYKYYMKAVTKLNHYSKNILSLKQLIARLEDVIITSLIELS